MLVTGELWLALAGVWFCFLSGLWLASLSLIFWLALVVLWVGSGWLWSALVELWLGFCGALAWLWWVLAGLRLGSGWAVVGLRCLRLIGLVAVGSGLVLTALWLGFDGLCFEGFGCSGLPGVGGCYGWACQRPGLQGLGSPLLSNLHILEPA